MMLRLEVPSERLDRMAGSARASSGEVGEFWDRWVPGPTPHQPPNATARQQDQGAATPNPQDTAVTTTTDIMSDCVRIHWGTVSVRGEITRSWLSWRKKFGGCVATAPAKDNYIPTYM